MLDPASYITITKDEFQTICAFMLYSGMTTSKTTLPIQTLKIIFWLSAQQKKAPETLRNSIDLITALLSEELEVSKESLEKIIQ